MTIEKKTRKPRTTESITAGALSLTLAEGVKLCNTLKETIHAEVRLAEIKAKEAAEAAGELLKGM